MWNNFHFWKVWTRSIFPIPHTKHWLKPWTLYIKQTQDCEREECRLARDFKTQEMTPAVSSPHFLASNMFDWVLEKPATSKCNGYRKSPKKSLLSPVKEPERSSLERQPLDNMPSTPSPSLPPSAQGQVESLDLWPPQAMRHLPSFLGGVRRDLATHSGLSPLVSNTRPPLSPQWQ